MKIRVHYYHQQEQVLELSRLVVVVAFLLGGGTIQARGGTVESDGVRPT